MTPITFYTSHIENGEIIHDACQWQVLMALEKLHENLIKEQQNRQSIWGRFKKRGHILGIYLWGGVGVGKTFLMDCFYQSIPFPQKKRIHFHAFMQWVHEQLKGYKGISNPLVRIAKEFARDVTVLCFDEFIVNDVANAMLLKNLLTAFFEQGICIVATSNTEPDQLYLHGLQREAFLPAIAQIKAYMQIIHILSDKDYRLHNLKNAPIFFTPDNPESEIAMQKLFSILTQHEVKDHYAIAIDERLIPIKQKAGRVIWFEFKALCQNSLSQNDYIEITKQYQTVFISNIPIISENATNTISRFINLIDVFYDAHIRIVCSAATPIDELYTRGTYQLDFQRTMSRLIEMQSEKYWETNA